jgi:hypothetical protein
MVHLITAIATPTGAFSIGITLLQAAMVCVTYNGERTNPMEYSKFASIKEDKLKNPIPSKLGMLIIYAPATLVASLYAFSDHFPSSLVAPLIFLHFLKRTLETLGLHKYSGKMEAQNGCIIGTSYVLYTMLISSYAVPLGANDEAWSTLGYAFFIVGIVGNFYHHVLLASLRKDSSNKGEKRYQPPVGGAFSLVATPHFFFELLVWLGIACVAQQVHAFLVLAAMTSYLTARAKNTNEYYFVKFGKDEWPRSRKAIVPGVF